jgi:hypothetical protein
MRVGVAVAALAALALGGRTHSVTKQSEAYEVYGETGAAVA